MLDVFIYSYSSKILQNLQWMFCVAVFYTCKVSYWRFLYCVLCSSAEKQSNNRLLWIHFDPSLMYE